jgi:hypothetical protein
LKALELAASRDELCGKRFMIESDSANVVNWMRDKSKRPWKFHDIFIRAARFMAVLKLVHYAPCSMALTNILIYLLSFFLRNELGDLVVILQKTPSEVVVANITCVILVW